MTTNHALLSTPSRVYVLYWSIYLLIFSLIEGLPANTFFTALLGEIATLLPKIIFVTIVAEVMLPALFVRKDIKSFCIYYIALLLAFAFALRLIDNYIIIQYLLPHWRPEPLLSAAPFLYNCIKLQFLVTIPFAIKLISSKLSDREPGIVQVSISAAKKYLQVVSDRRMTNIPFESVHYFETKGNSILIYAKDGVHKTYLPVAKLFEQLPEGMFLRIHRSFIVAVEKASSLSAAEVIVNGKKIPIGRSYSAKVKKMLI